MKSIINPIVRAWQWWFTPRANDPTVLYRERALRFLLPLFLLLRILAIQNAYSGTATASPPYFSIWVAITVSVPLVISLYFLLKDHIGWSGIFFILNWYLVDMLNLPADGYWNAGFQISLIIQIVLGTLLLPSRAILPFLIIQLATVGIWGYWLDANHFDVPLLSSGQPVAYFQRTIITLSIQETIILFTVRYLRLEMEKSLRTQKKTITQLEKEITERSRMEAEREKFIRELEQKNAELERFTYTVSHDLKSPLVTIKGFLGMLRKDLNENKQEHAQKDMHRIAEAAEKMGTLLSELIELSRIGRIVNPPEEVDLEKLIKDTLETLDGKIRTRNITVTILPNLPVVYADRNRLREVLENLIDNAAKYMGDQPSPLIEIGKRGNGTGHILYIKDNGIGIEPRYHTKIFGLFEKLSALSEGTGIGLALVKRIIETHGGKIWVESEGLGKGSTFCFTILDNRARE